MSAVLCIAKKIDSLCPGGSHFANSYTWVISFTWGLFLFPVKSLVKFPETPAEIKKENIKIDLCKSS